VAPEVKGQRGDAALDQIHHQRSVAVTGSGILVSQYHKREPDACVGVGIGEGSLQNEAVPGRNGHLQRSEDHARPSCRVSRCHSSAEMTP
jgi:hypothetical protein